MTLNKKVILKELDQESEIRDPVLVLLLITWVLGSPFPLPAPLWNSLSLFVVLRVVWVVLMYSQGWDPLS